MPLPTRQKYRTRKVNTSNLYDWVSEHWGIPRRQVKTLFIMGQYANSLPTSREAVIKLLDNIEYKVI